MNPNQQQPQQIHPQQPQQRYAQPQQRNPQQQPSQPAAAQNQQRSTPPAQPKSNPNSTQNTLQVAEIRDGILIMADGSYRSVIMAQSINFDLMSQQEREAVEFSYQGFLNSLYFPIQILIRSQKVDLQPYVQKLEKLHNEQDNMLLAYLMEDYISYIQYLAQETNIMDKQFYIVIPYFSDLSAKQAAQKSRGIIKSLFGSAGGASKKRIIIGEAELEAAKTELKNRVQSTLGALLQMGVQGIPLDTQELIELFYDVYNPDTATHSGALTKADFNTPVVSKGVGIASQPHLDSEIQR